MKIFDCFTFYNEIELLKFRLELLFSSVDFFVIVECSRTQTGLSKPFNYLSHKDEFAQWASKILYVQADDVPEYKGKDDWSIENYQRNCILRGLSQLSPDPDDLIILSDLDEIVNPSVLHNLDGYTVMPFSSAHGLKLKIRRFLQQLGMNKRLIAKNTLSRFLEYMPVTLQQDHFYYFLDCRRNSKWYGTILFKYRFLGLPQTLRDNRENLPFVIGNVGWHFSYLGGKTQVMNKLKAIVEGHNVKIPEGFSADEYVSACIENGKDIYGAKNVHYSFIDPQLIGIDGIEYYIEKFPDFFKSVSRKVD